jgi:hypothetical protein
MGRSYWAAGLVAGLLVAGPGRPADPDTLIAQAQDAPKGKELPKTKDLPKAKEPPKVKEPPKPKEPVPEALVRTDASLEAPEGYFSRIMGDWIGAYYADRFVQLPGVRVTTTVVTTPVFTRGVGPQGEPILIRTDVPIGTTTTAESTLVTTRARVPVPTRGGFKIAENERVVPEDRAYLAYNFYRNVMAPGGSPSVPQTSLIGANPTLTQTFVPPATWDVHRAVLGFETTFFDGTASFGVRAPFYNVQGDGSLTGSDFGDLSFILKGLVYWDGSDAASVGLVVTAPTGPAIPTVAGDIRSTLFQPWVGGIVSLGDAFAMGFSSLVIPTDSRDVTLLFNDIGVGLLVYRGAPGDPVAWVAPTAEVHVTTPLNNRSRSDPLTVPDMVVLTQGVQVGLGDGSSFAVGVAVPITGPRPFDWEAMLQFNVRY